MQHLCWSYCHIYTALDTHGQASLEVWRNAMLLQVSHHSYQHLSLSCFKGSTQPSTQGSHFVLKEARQAAADAMKHEIFGHMGQVQEKILKSWLEHTFDL